MLEIGVQQGKKKLKRYTYRVTWNVRGHSFEGDLKDLEADVEKYKINILTIIKTKQNKE